MRFETTAALVAWMEGHYLSELVLLDLAPKPSDWRAAKRVTLVLGLPDREWTGKQDRFFAFGLQAEGVRAWTADGPLDRQAELTIEALPGDGVALRVRAEGCATLAADAVVAEVLEPRLRRAAPRPWRHDFTMWGDDPTRTVGDLLPDGASLASLDGVRALPSWPLCELRDRSGRAWVCTAAAGPSLAYVSPVFRPTPGWTLRLTRTDADDATWEHLWRLPARLGATRVISRTVDTDAIGWTRWDFRKGTA